MGANSVSSENSQNDNLFTQDHFELLSRNIFLTLNMQTAMFNSDRGWNFSSKHFEPLKNLEYVDEKSILKSVCSEFYPNFTSSYKEYVNCIDEQAFSADDLIHSWNNGERLQQSYHKFFYAFHVFRNIRPGEGLWKSDVFWANSLRSRRRLLSQLLG